jgi:hypothetical protein
MDQKDEIKKDWLRIFSPCIIASVICLVIIISSLISINRSGGWSYLGVIIYVPCLFLFLIADVVAKAFIKNNAGSLWVIECMIIIVAIFILNSVGR